MKTLIYASGGRICQAMTIILASSCILTQPYNIRSLWIICLCNCTVEKFL